jgi:hypothetical protein
LERNEAAILRRLKCGQKKIQKKRRFCWTTNPHRAQFRKQVRSSTIEFDSNERGWRYVGRNLGSAGFTSFGLRRNSHAEAWTPNLLSKKIPLRMVYTL